MKRGLLITGFLVAATLAISIAGFAKDTQAEVKESVRHSDFGGVNAVLAAQGANVRILKADYIAAPGSGDYGGTIFAWNVGNKQLGADWVPFDPNRYGDRNIYYLVDMVDTAATGGVAPADLEAAIDSAMTTWNSVSCSNIPIVKVPDYGYDWGYVQYLLGYGGVPGWYADYTHAGWLPPAFFDAIAADGSQYILGVTFTFVWTEGGEYTDMDHNGKLDVAFRETYYNNNFTWAVYGPTWQDPEFDVETIALHEAGHGLSQAHFGKMFVDASDTEPPYDIQHLHFAPRAVMNAVYWETQRELLGTDVGGHCSIWANWPMQ